MLEANRVILETLEPGVNGELDADSRIEGRVVIAPGARIVRSQIRGPAIVAGDAEVLDSYIGPYTAIGERCRVEESEVEHSILMAEAKLIGVRRIADSIIGRGAEVMRDEGSQRAYRLLIGDLSSVGVVP